MICLSNVISERPRLANRFNPGEADDFMG